MSSSVHTQLAADPSTLLLLLLPLHQMCQKSSRFPSLLSWRKKGISLGNIPVSPEIGPRAPSSTNSRRHGKEVRVDVGTVWKVLPTRSDPTRGCSQELNDHVEFLTKREKNRKEKGPFPPAWTPEEEKGQILVLAELVGVLAREELELAEADGTVLTREEFWVQPGFSHPPASTCSTLNTVKTLFLELNIFISVVCFVRLQRASSELNPPHVV